MAAEALLHWLPGLLGCRQLKGLLGSSPGGQVRGQLIDVDICRCAARQGTQQRACITFSSRPDALYSTMIQ